MTYHPNFRADTKKHWTCWWQRLVVCGVRTTLTTARYARYAGTGVTGVAFSVGD